jgi:hypothetical protein
MTDRAKITEFLKAALAAGTMAVRDPEAKARGPSFPGPAYRNSLQRQRL